MKALNRRHDEFTQGLTPLIDVVLQLIVFFLVSTTFVRPEKSIDIQLPTADAAQGVAEEQSSVIVNVRQSGLMVVEGRVLAGIEELDEILRAAYSRNAGVTVIIRGDREALHKDIVKVMNAVLNVGIGEMSIAVFETQEE
jgi:biopolymer transport protein ExbD